MKISDKTVRIMAKTLTRHSCIKSRKSPLEPTGCVKMVVVVVLVKSSVYMRMETRVFK
jgi:hypothetical protein